MVAVWGGWCRRYLGVLGVPCGAAGVLRGVHGFLGFSIGQSGCGLFSLETLVFLGVRGSIPLALVGPGGPCVDADALVVLLDAYRGAGVGACAAGPGLSWLSLDFLLGGFWKGSTDSNNPICYFPT